MSTWTALTGQDAARNAGKAARQSQQQQQYATQQYEQYMVPLLQMMLQQARTQQPITQQMQGIQGAMLSPTQNQGALPWWMQVPDTSGVEQGFSTLSRLGLDQATKNMQGDISQYYAQRGIPMSQQQANLIPRFRSNFLNALATENANKALMLDQLKTQRRGEAQTGFYNLGNYLTGQQINPGLASTGVSMGQNNANMYNQQAQQYGQQSGLFGGVLGNILGNMYGGGLFGGGTKAQSNGSGGMSGTWPVGGALWQYNPLG